MLSLGLAVIFGLMGVVNFAHGAFYTLGAFAALLGLQWLGINYWAALVLAPLAVGLLGIVVERLFLRHALRARPALRAAADLRARADRRGLAAPAVRRLRPVLSGAAPRSPGALNLGFMILPLYRAWVIAGLAWSCASAPGSSSSAPGSARRCAPPPRTRRCCRPSASTCRCWSPRPTAAAWRSPRSPACCRRRSCW